MSDYYMPSGTQNTVKDDDQKEDKKNNITSEVEDTEKQDTTPPPNINPPEEPTVKQPQQNFDNKGDVDDKHRREVPSNIKGDTGNIKDSPTEAAKKAKPEDSYNIFTESLLVDLGFSDLQEPEKSKLTDSIHRRVETRVLRVLLESLSDKQREELDRETKEKGLDGKDIIKLMTKRAPHASDAILSALDDLYFEMKEESKIVWKAAAGKAVADQANERLAKENSKTDKDQSKDSQGSQD